MMYFLRFIPFLLLPIIALCTYSEPDMPFIPTIEHSIILPIVGVKPPPPPPPPPPAKVTPSVSIVQVESKKVIPQPALVRPIVGVGQTPKFFMPVIAKESKTPRITQTPTVTKQQTPKPKKHKKLKISIQVSKAKKIKTTTTSTKAPKATKVPAVKVQVAKASKSKPVYSVKKINMN